MSNNWINVEHDKPPLGSRVLTWNGLTQAIYYIHHGTLDMYSISNWKYLDEPPVNKEKAGFI